MTTADFHTDLDYANNSRLRLDKHFYPHMSFEGRFVPVERSPGSLYIQREVHIDCIVASHEGGSLTIEEKIVRWPGYHYTALTIETHSNLERARGAPLGDGWIVTSKADFLLYAFEQAEGQLRVWVYDLPRLRAWFLEKYQNYRITDTNNHWYTTRCRIVPLAHIPKDIIRIHGRMA